MNVPFTQDHPAHPTPVSDPLPSAKVRRLQSRQVVLLEIIERAASSGRIHDVLAASTNLAQVHARLAGAKVAEALVTDVEVSA